MPLISGRRGRWRLSSWRMRCVCVGATVCVCVGVGATVCVCIGVGEGVCVCVYRCG
jgi:hypothetical protein